MANKVIVENIEYNSLRQAAKFYNKEYNIVKGRVALGWSLEEALELVERNQITINGKTFKSKQEACRYYRVARSTVDARLNNGYSLEEAFTKKSKRRKKYKKRKPVILGNKSFKSKADAARYHNLDIDIIYGRERIGWTLEEAFELVPRTEYNNSERSITVENVTYKSLMVACKHYNLNYNTVYTRLKRRGWSIEEALELIPRKRNK